VSPLPEEEQLRIDTLLHSSDSLRKAFEEYEARPRPIDLLVNLRFGQFPNSDRTQFKSACESVLSAPIQQGLTLDDVLELVRSAGYQGSMGKTPQLATLQLVSPNHELRGAEFVLRRYRLLDF
jgi:hypothetical protein